MKDLQRIPMDYPKLKFGTTMDAIGVYSAEIDCIEFLNDAFDTMRTKKLKHAASQIAWRQCNSKNLSIQRGDALLNFFVLQYEKRHQVR